MQQAMQTDTEFLQRYSPRMRPLDMSEAGDVGQISAGGVQRGGKGRRGEGVLPLYSGV